MNLIPGKTVYGEKTIAVKVWMIWRKIIIKKYWMLMKTINLSSNEFSEILNWKSPSYKKP